jgi:hypothetical protein
MIYVVSSRDDYDEPSTLIAAFSNKEDADRYKSLSTSGCFIEEVELNSTFEHLIPNKEQADLLEKLFTNYFPGVKIDGKDFYYIGGEDKFFGFIH